MKREAALEIARTQLEGKTAEQLAEWLMEYTAMCAQQLGNVITGALFSNLSAYGFKIPRALEDRLRAEYAKQFGARTAAQGKEGAA